MTTRLTTSRSGLDLIKSFEGFRATEAKLPGGKVTVGYGHVCAPSRSERRISEADAEGLLVGDLRVVERAIQEMVLAPLTQNEFDALVSFTYNIGVEAFAKSDVLRRLNAGEPLAAAAAMDAWRKARIDGRLYTIDALVRRRASEKAMFLDHPAGRPIAPSSVVRPEIDLTAAVFAPSDPGLSISTPLEGDVAQVRAGAAPERANGGPTIEEAASSTVERLQRIGQLSGPQTKPANDAPAAAPAPAPAPRVQPQPARVAPIKIEEWVERPAPPKRPRVLPSMDLDIDEGDGGILAISLLALLGVFLLGLGAWQTFVQAEQPLSWEPVNAILSMWIVGAFLLALATWFFIQRAFRGEGHGGKSTPVQTPPAVNAANPPTEPARKVGGRRA